MKFYSKIQFFYFLTFLFLISPFFVTKNLYSSSKQKEEEVKVKEKKEKDKNSKNTKVIISGAAILTTGVVCYFAWPYVKKYFSNKKEDNHNPTPDNLLPDSDTPILFYNKGEPYYQFTNFWDQNPIQLDGKLWPTAEHYYQAQKYTGCGWLEKRLKKAIRKVPTAGELYQIIHGKAPNDEKEILQEFEHYRKDWKQVNVPIMHKVVKAKFEQHKDLKKLLLSTGKHELIENSHRDSFWGIGKDGKGQNMLGKVLMQVRDELT